MSRRPTSSEAEEHLRINKRVLQRSEELKRIRQEFDQHLKNFHANADGG
jgi:hypothetical protein